VKAKGNSVNRIDILAAASEVIEDVTGYPHANISLEQILAKDLGVDSLALWQVVLGFEERFEISIPDADVKTWVCVAVVLDYWESHS
jgi:acyl carrier protein